MILALKFFYTSNYSFVSSPKHCCHTTLVAKEGGVGVITHALLTHYSSSGRRWSRRHHPNIAATLL